MRPRPWGRSPESSTPIPKRIPPLMLQAPRGGTQARTSSSGQPSLPPGLPGAGVVAGARRHMCPCTVLAGPALRRGCSSGRPVAGTQGVRPTSLWASRTSPGNQLVLHIQGSKSTQTVSSPATLMVLARPGHGAPLALAGAPLTASDVRLGGERPAAREAECYPPFFASRPSSQTAGRRPVSNSR